MAQGADYAANGMFCLIAAGRASLVAVSIPGKPAS
jgi:hypothetical protein